MRIRMFASITLLIIRIGCLPNLTSAEIQPSPTTVKESSFTPTNRLQITYIQNKVDQNFGELYGKDITCITPDKICFGKPKLLFRSLKMPNNHRNEPKGLLTDYSWSPDGKKLVLISAGDILIGNMTTQEWINITDNPNIREFRPKWSSDGKFIYYIECLEDSSGMCTPQILRFDSTGHGKIRLLSKWNKHITPDYDISPDGQKIVFAISGPLAISDLLYQANVDGTDSNQMTEGDVSENAPSFSPHGKKIAFVRSTILYYVDSKEQSDIIVKDLVSGEEENLTENFGGLAFSPIFSPNGEWIAFDSFDSEYNVNVFLVSLEQKIIVQVTQGNEETDPAWRWISEQ